MSVRPRRAAAAAQAPVTPPALPRYLSPTEAGCRVRVHVQPRARTTEIAGCHGDRLKLRVAAPPADGAANAACIQVLAEQLRVPRAAVTLVRGARSRDKDFGVEGVSAHRAQAIFEGNKE